MRTLLILGVVWFVAADVCRVLGIRNPRDAVADLDEDEKTVVNTDGLSMRGPPANLISESGLYALILRSRKPAALKFRKWVTGEVLPALRRDGYYALRHASAANPIEENHCAVYWAHWFQ